MYLEILLSTLIGGLFGQLLLEGVARLPERLQLLARAAIIALLLLAFASVCHAQPRRNPKVQAATAKWLVQRIGANEIWGTNRGPEVDMIIRAGGGNPYQQKPPEWCGFTQAADQRANGLPIPARGMQGAARAWFCADAKCKVMLDRTFYYIGKLGSLDSIQPGDITGFAWRPSVVIHHVTRCAEVVPGQQRGRPPMGFYTLGGNEGHGVTAGLKRTFYPATSITAAARWDYK